MNTVTQSVDDVPDGGGSWWHVGDIVAPAQTRSGRWQWISCRTGCYSSTEPFDDDSRRRNLKLKTRQNIKHNASDPGSFQKGQEIASAIKIVQNRYVRLQKIKRSRPSLEMVQRKQNFAFAHRKVATKNLRVTMNRKHSSLVDALVVKFYGQTSKQIRP